MAYEGSEHPLDRRIDDVAPVSSPVSRISRNSIVINKKRLAKIRRKLSDPDADVPVPKTMFEVDDGDSIFNADAIAAARARAARRTKGLDSQDMVHGDSFSDIAAASGRTHRGARDSIVLAHDRLSSPTTETLLPRLSTIPDEGDDVASEMQRLDIIEAARKRAVMHKKHKDSMGGGVYDQPAPAGRPKIRSRDSMVLNRVRLTEPVSGGKIAKIRSRDSVVLHKVRLQPPTGGAASADSGKPLHKGWLLKNPIAERASIKAKWKVPGGRAKRRWFVLYSTSDRNMPSLSYYTDEKQSTLKGTLYLDTTWSVQRAKNSAKKKLTFELFSERQGLLVEAYSVEDSNTWLHYLETLLRRLKRVTK